MTDRESGKPRFSILQLFGLATFACLLFGVLSIGYMARMIRSEFRSTVAELQRENAELTDANKALKELLAQSESNRRNVVGELGLPLGTAVEVDAEVVSGRSLRRKGDDLLYLLKVMNVDGKELQAPLVMRFSSPEFGSVELPNHSFGLYEMKYGVKAKNLDASQISELEKGYVGRKLRLVVYEIGSYEGVPDQLPNDVPSWADSGFQFSSSLIVLKERDPDLKSSGN